MSESRETWTYRLYENAMNAEGKRTGTPSGALRELWGADFSTTGGVQPFDGFLDYTDLVKGAGSSNFAGGRLDDLWALQARIEGDEYWSGILYRVINNAGNTAYYRLKLRTSTGGSWLYDSSFGSEYNQGLITPESYAGETMDVVVVGRLVYVFRRGKEPFVFYIRKDNLAYGLAVQSDTGPGPQPRLVAPSPNAVCVRSRTDLPPGTPHPDMAEVFPALGVPSGGVDAEVRLLYLGFSDLEPVKAGPAVELPTLTNPNLTVRSEATGGMYSEALRGPSDILYDDGDPLWDPVPFPDPDFEDAYIYSGGELIQPIYPVPTPRGEYNGYQYLFNDRDIEGKEPVGLPEEDMVWAYRLLDSRTGRSSPLSNRLVARPAPEGVSSVMYNLITVAPNEQENDRFTPVTFPLLFGVYDSDRYDRLLLYRGRLISGLTEEQVDLSLDSVVTLEDWHTSKQPAGLGSPMRSFAYFAQTDRDALVLQPKWSGSSTYLADMPTAGAAYLYENIVLLGNIGSVDEDAEQETEAGAVSRGVIRWSSPYLSGIEVFASGDRQLLNGPNEEVIRFAKAGATIVGFSTVEPWFVRKETVVVKAFPFHSGFTIANPRAADEVGSEIYFVGATGVRTVGPSGELSDVSVINDIVWNEWRQSHHLVQLAFDRLMQVVVIFNPVEEEVVLFWFSTSRVCRLADCNFECVRRGHTPLDLTAAPSLTNPLKERAVFGREVRDSDNRPYWKVSVLDYRGDSMGVRTFPYVGPAVLSLSIGAGASSNVLDFGVSLAAFAIEGCYIYVASGPHAGFKSKVVRLFTGDDSAVVLETNIPATFDAGTRFFVSPVYFKALGSALWIQDPSTGGALPPSYRVARVAQSMSACFTDIEDVEGDLLPGDKRFRALIYRGNQPEHEEAAFAVNTDGSDIDSVVEGVSPLPASFNRAEDGSVAGVRGVALFPALEIFVTDLSYTLLEFEVDGQIEEEGRSSIPDGE